MAAPIINQATQRRKLGNSQTNHDTNSVLGEIMAQIIPFPDKSKNDSIKATDIKKDPYYLFLKSVLTTADSCGFKLPFTIDSAAEHVYKKTIHKSQLAKMLRKQAR